MTISILFADDLDSLEPVFDNDALFASYKCYLLSIKLVRASWVPHIGDWNLKLTPGQQVYLCRILPCVPIKFRKKPSFIHLALARHFDFKYAFQLSDIDFAIIISDQTTSSNITVVRMSEVNAQWEVWHGFTIFSQILKFVSVILCHLKMKLMNRCRVAVIVYPKLMSVAKLF